MSVIVHFVPDSYLVLKNTLLSIKRRSSLML